MGCPRPNVPRSDARDIGELANPLRDRVYTMMYDAPGRGLVAVSGYRDPGRQWDLRHDRVPHGQECNPKVAARPATAVPYASNHGKRLAVDLGGRAQSWANANCHRYGLWLAVRTEDWHYEAKGNPTVRILRYPGPTYEGAAAGGAPIFARQPAKQAAKPAPAPVPPKLTPEQIEEREIMAAANDIIDNTTNNIINEVRARHAEMMDAIAALRADVDAQVGGAITLVTQVLRDVEQREVARDAKHGR